MDTKQFETQIHKTGFVLENQIAQDLKAANWTVISNKYYVDDAEETVREIDLVAYQASKVQHFDVYTTLIISCKKSEANAWALLARDINLKDPNSDWWPLHAWSNDKALHFQLSDPRTARRYHEQIAQLGVTKALATPMVEVFAFQEMSLANGSPQNDRSIFAAVTSLMKAQAYELGSLPQRRKMPAVYQFNLISVVDAELVRLIFKDNDIICSPIEAEHYLARYIVKKKETFSRIRFLRAESFAKALPDYGRLHKANCQWFASEYDAFYFDIVKKSDKRNVLIEDFKQEIGWYIAWQIERLGYNKPDLSSLFFYWDETKATVVIYTSSGIDVAKHLNENTEVKQRVAKALKKIFQYDGSFVFETDETPF